LLASLENYTSAVLGPHFPPQTVLGLRRSATPYQVAHTVALTSDGQIWIWAASDAVLDDPLPADSAAPELATALAAVELEGLEESYGATCPQGSGVESLYLQVAGVEKQVELICPELALPGNLLPVYLELDILADQKLAGSELEHPSPEMPVDSLLLFRRADGTQMTVFHDGRVLALDNQGITYSSTLTSSLVMSLTAGLMDSGRLDVGAAALLERVEGNILVVRAPEGVFSGQWGETIPDEIAEFVARLGAAMDRVTGTPVAPELTPTPKAEATPSATQNP
jgi:hypothetical protein